VRVSVREAMAADETAIGDLLWRQQTEENAYTGTDRAGFQAQFCAWVADHRSTHLPFLAEVDGEAVGVAWLMVADRVPNPARRLRRFGDVQSVCVAPERRSGGIGALLLEAVLAEARKLGLEHVTVHSSSRAVTLYERVGFQLGPSWLRWRPD
jgi:GNAT superfamily N-acetyltransferase